jgi:acetyltransferase
MDLEKLFNPKSIAIVGATDEDGKVGTAVCNNILNLGYEGKVFLVNPKHEKLFQHECYPNLEAIREPIDLAIIVIPAKFVSQVIQGGGELVKNFVIISAGFSETSEEGKKFEQEILEIAKEKDLNILGPNCLGFIVPKLKLNASFGGGIPKPGNISFVSQSGALISAVLDISKSENFGFSNIISIGNKMQIDESNLFEYLEQDLETKVVGMYLEGIKDGKKFRELAEKISKSKPVVILKAGKTEKSQKAISSHTGALAGSEEIIKALFKKTGIIEASSFSEFLNLVKLISLSNTSYDKKFAIITNAGGPGVLTTDNFSGKKIEIAEISEKIKEKLREFLPQASSVENPIDLLGDAQEDRYEKTLETINEESLGGIICVLTPQENTPEEKIAKKIIEFKDKTQKTITAIFLGGEKIKKSVALLKESGIPTFDFPEEAIGSLDKYYQWEEKKNKVEIKRAEAEKNSERIQKTLEIIKQAESENRTALYFSESARVMELYGIKTVDFQEINTSEALEIDFPMVMKVDSDKVLHKTDKQGLILNIKNEDEFREAYQKMSDNFPKEKVIIQPMQEVKTELILGIKKDETVGPVVVFGLGGIYTEIFKMVDFLIPPTSPQEIQGIIMESPIRFLFQENRGQNAHNLEEICEILFKLSLLAQEIEEIKEFDINPLLIYNNNQEALAVDVKIII